MPQACDGSEPAPWRVGASSGGFDTDIVFDGEAVHTRQLAASASVGRAVTPRWGWTVTGSYVIDGTIEDRDIRNGGGLSAGASYLAVYERARRPFIAFTGNAGAARVRAVADDGRVRDWTASDVRVGLMSGKTIGRAVPYLAARAFSGPVFWHRDGASVAGGDARHVTAGAGISLRLPFAMDFTAEIMPLGEQSASAGLTLHR